MQIAEVIKIVTYLNKVSTDLAEDCTDATLRLYPAGLYLIILQIEDAIPATRDQELQDLLLLLKNRAQKFMQEIEARLGVGY
jgi:hypothetical protein